jgi:Domain of unknown function (DUF4386)
MSRFTQPAQPTGEGNDQRAARRAGVLLLISFVTSVPALVLYDPVLNEIDYVVSAGADKRMFLGAFLEVLLIIANVGTAVVLFTPLRRVTTLSRWGMSRLASSSVPSLRLAFSACSRW